MIKLNLTGNEIKIKFGSENFQEIFQLLKSNHFKYDISSKSWTDEYCKIYNIIPQLQNIEDFEISDDIKKLIEPKSNVKFVRRQFRKELLKSEPIVGKFPNENYQIDDIKKTLCSNRKIINWDTGLGKSYLSSVVISHLFNDNEVDCCLIVAPNHLKINWKKELKRFFYKDLTDEDFYVTSIFNRNPFESNKKIIITSYRNLVMISDDYYKKEKGKKSKKYRKTCLPIKDWYKNRCVILDESHSIKNNSRQTQILLQIKDFFEFRYLLSATIAPNSIIDLFYQFEFLDENIIYNSYQGFLDRIAYLGTRFSAYDIKVDKDGNRIYKEEEIKKFKDEVSKYIIVRKKEDCLDLPDHRINKIYCSLEGINLEIYKNVISYCLNIVKEEKGYIDSIEVKNKLPYILQALNNINMLKEKIDKNKNNILFKLIEKWKFSDHSKIEDCNELLDKYINEEEQKVIIFSYHPKTIEDLKEYYQKYNPLIIHGQIDITGDNKDREEEKDSIINLFKVNKENNLLISNPTIIKTGLNIVESSRIIYFDRDYNFETYYQSKDRIYRIGQDKKTIIDNLIIENSFDEIIDKCLDSKKDVNDLFVNSETKNVNEWRNLFEGRLK
jgi:SNF2 family DNA or RNA helicase